MATVRYHGTSGAEWLRTRTPILLCEAPSAIRDMAPILSDPAFLRSYPKTRESDERIQGLTRVLG